MSINLMENVLAESDQYLLFSYTVILVFRLIFIFYFISALFEYLKKF